MLLLRIYQVRSNLYKEKQHSTKIDKVEGIFTNKFLACFLVLYVILYLGITVIAGCHLEGI